MDEIDAIHTHATMEYYSAIKEGNSAVCDYMDRPWGYYRKWKKSDRDDTFILLSHWYMASINQNKTKNNSSYPELIGTENRWVVSRSGKWETGKMGKGGQKVKTLSYKINKS